MTQCSLRRFERPFRSVSLFGFTIQRTDNLDRCMALLEKRRQSTTRWSNPLQDKILRMPMAIIPWSKSEGRHPCSRSLSPNMSPHNIVIVRSWAQNWDLIEKRTNSMRSPAPRGWGQGQITPRPRPIHKILSSMPTYRPTWHKAELSIKSLAAVQCTSLEKLNSPINNQENH